MFLSHPLATIQYCGEPVWSRGSVTVVGLRLEWSLVGLHRDLILFSPLGSCSVCCMLLYGTDLKQPSKKSCSLLGSDHILLADCLRHTSISQFNSEDNAALELITCITYAAAVFTVGDRVSIPRYDIQVLKNTIFFTGHSLFWGTSVT